jgi:glutathione S-transferase
VRIALSEKHVPWEPIYVNLRANAHKTPEFLALNPYGKVLSRLETHLQGKTFLVRERFTLADICFAPRIVMLDQLGTPLNPAYTNVPAWIARIRQRASTQGLET